MIKNTMYDDVVGLGKLYNFKDKESCVANYELQMFARTSRMFTYNGLPETIKIRDLEKLLQFNGYAILIKEKGNWYAVNGGLGGNQDDPNYNPTWAQVVNVGLDISKRYTIGKDCIVIWNDSSHVGLLPIFSKYASSLVENDITLNMVDIQKRIVAVFSAKTPNTIEECKAYLRKVVEGELGVIADKTTLESLSILPMATTNVDLKDFIELNQYLKVSWYNEIGLNGNYNMKRESLNSNESQLNEDMLNPLPDDMLIERQEGLERFNEFSGLNITCEFSDAWKNEEDVLPDTEDSEDKESGEEDV